MGDDFDYFPFLSCIDQKYGHVDKLRGTGKVSNDSQILRQLKCYEVRGFDLSEHRQKSFAADRDREEEGTRAKTTKIVTIELVWESCHSC